MAYLIEKKDGDGRWRPIGYAYGLGGIDDDMLDLPFRVTELSIPQIDYRFAKADADRALSNYLKCNARAYDLKIKIRPMHWPVGVGD